MGESAKRNKTKGLLREKLKYEKVMRRRSTVKRENENRFNRENVQEESRKFQQKVHLEKAKSKRRK